MSGFFDDSHVTDVGLQGSTGPSVSLWELAEQTVRQQFRVDSQRALDEELRTRWYESLIALRTAGQNFNAPVNPMMYRDYARYVREGTPVTMPTTEGTGYGARINYDRQQPHPEFEEMRRANEAIRQLNNPDIKTFEQILEEVSQMQRETEERTASMSERAGPFGILAELAGGIVGSFTPRDPLNVVTAPIGAGRTIMTRVGTDMLVAAGVVTATEFGDVQPNRELAQLPERSPFFNIAVATIGAGAIRGGLEGAGYGVRRLRERFAPEEVDFTLNDSLLRQMFEQRPESPTARAGLQALDDATFIERNNPYGDGQAAQARFLAELQQVQRAMNGEPMTAIARVLPPVPFEFIQKAADFEIVREQRPLVYARMEQAQQRVEDLTRQVERAAEQKGPDLIEAVRLVDQEAAGQLEQLSVRVNDETLPEATRVVADIEAQAIINRVGVERVTKAADAFDAERKFRVRNLRATRRAANREYRKAHQAVETEAARLREKEARIEATEQGKAANIFAVGLEGRSFNLPILKHDYVAELVERINAIGDKLDEITAAPFVRPTESVAEVASPTYYHAGPKGIKEFSDQFDRTGKSKTNKEYGGIYFTSSREKASSYLREGGEIYSVRLDIKNPLTLPSEEFPDISTGLLFREEIDAIKARGYDAVVSSKGGETVVFSPEQVKIDGPSWVTRDGRVDIGLKEPVDPEFTFFVDEGEMSVAAAMRDLQDDADLDEAMRTCLI